MGRRSHFVRSFFFIAISHLIHSAGLYYFSYLSGKSIKTVFDIMESIKKQLLKLQVKEACHRRIIKHAKLFVKNNNFRDKIINEEESELAKNLIKQKELLIKHKKLCSELTENSKKFKTD